MDSIINNIDLKLNPELFIKDPQSSNLGKKIIAGGVDLIAKIGFDQFTFKKLGQEIESSEASIYRYFESKHKLLLYIVSWYWGWMEYYMAFSLANISSPIERLRKSIQVLTQEVTESPIPGFNKNNLEVIIISEAPKSFLIKNVGDENSKGFYLPYKQLVDRIGQIVLEINPDYPNPHMLISTIMEGCHFQRYFARHLPRLTDAKTNETSKISDFFIELTEKAIS